MNSREFDGMLDNLLRQALYPFAEAEPPARVWRRVLRAVRSKRTGLGVATDQPLLAVLAALSGMLATISRCLEFLSAMKERNVIYVPFFSNRAYYVDQNGHCLSLLFWDITLTQMFDLRLAS